MKQQLLEEKEEKKIKLPNEEGFFFLDRIKIKYKFDKEQFGNPHLEFWSVEDKKPNILSDTGYRSWFVNWDLTESVITSVKQLIEMYLEAELKDRKAEYTLEFEGEVKAEKEVENTDSAWNDIHKLTKRCDGKEEFAYLFVDYLANPTLESRNEYLSMSSTHEMPKGELGSSYGSWSWSYDKEDKDKTIEKLFEELLDFVKSEAEKPYHKTESGIATTTLSIKNVIVSFSNKAKKYLISLGFDFKKYETELKKIKQLEATKKDLMKSKTFEVMEKQMDKLKDTCWAIKGFFDEHSFLLKTSTNYNKNYYTKKLEDLKIDTTDLNKLKDLYNKKAKHYYIFYKKVYFQRWGKQTDEQYCYP